MLPSLAAAKPLLYTRRPISHICSRSFHSLVNDPFNVLALSLLSASAPVALVNSERQLVQQACAIGVHGGLRLTERVRRLAPLAQSDQVAGPGTQFVEGDDLLAALRRALQERVEWHGQSDDEPGP